MLNHLGDGCFYLQDFEMDQSEIPLLVKFLQSRTAIREVKSVELALKPGLSPQDRRRKPTVNSKNVSKHPEVSSNKLLLAVCDFIRSSHGLVSIVVDNVTITTEILAKLGDAMSSTHSQLQTLSFHNCPLESLGLRTLTPHLNKLEHMTQLNLQGCGLDDDSAAFLVSILRASEARMDQLYWNSTLRMSDPLDSLNSASSGAVVTEETNHVFSSGLVILDISGNNLSGKALSVMSRHLRNNHWLLALNLASNQLTATDFLGFVDSIRKGENSALATLLIKGNPGCLPQTCEALKDLTDQAPDRTDCMPVTLYEALRSLANEQAEELLTARDAASSAATDTGGESGASTTTPVQESGAEPPFDVDSTMLGRDAGTPRSSNEDLTIGERPQTAIGGKRGEGAGRGSSSGGDNMEYAIPTPVDSEDVTAFQGSPKMSDCGPVDAPEDISAGPEGLDDRRPPSRSGLRPRPRSAGSMIQSPDVGGADSAGFDPPAAGRGPSSSRRKVNRRTQPSSEPPAGMTVNLSVSNGTVDSVDLLGGPGMAVGTARTIGGSLNGRVVTGRRRTSPGMTRSRSAGPRTTLSTLASSSESIPFYPGGIMNGTNYDAIRKNGYNATPRARAAQYSEALRFQLQLMQGEDHVVEGREERAFKRAPKKKASKKKASKAAQAQKRVVASAPVSKVDTSMHASSNARRSPKKVTSGDKGNNAVRALAGAVEKVTKQLEVTADRMEDISDSLSESALNMSMNASRLGRQDDSFASERSVGAPKPASASTQTPPRGASPSKATNTDISPGSATSPPRYTRRRGGSGSGSDSPVNSPLSSPSRPRNRDKDITAAIRNNMREKLDRYLDEVF